MAPFKEKNQIQYVNADEVAGHYNVSPDTVVEWVKQGKISGEKSATNPDHYLIPKEEFEFLKKRSEQDCTEKEIRQLLGDVYEQGWEVEMDE